MAKSSKKHTSAYPAADPVPDIEELENLDLTAEPEVHADQEAPLLPALPAVSDGAGLPETVAPVTTLQQYLAEVRRYPYLSKEEELRLFHESQTQGSREAAVQLILAIL